MTDSFHRSLDASIARMLTSPEYPADHVRRWVRDYDAETSFQDLGFRQRFILGIDPGSIDPEEMKLAPNAIWQIPEPMTVTMQNVDIELLELLFGGPVIALCDRELPSKGTE